MLEASYMELDFEMFFEPKEGINTPQEFTEEILNWAKEENQNVVILEESMEPKIKIDDTEYVCKLGTPNVATENNKVWKAMGFKGVNQSVGRFLGYKWVYIYKI